ncbi:MAG: NifU family protein [Cytophagales bacterium]|nr:NifU family protein [Cytophagales bacterium]
MESTQLYQEQLKERVEKALDSIRPFLEADGGNVKMVAIDEERIVYLTLLGACSTCPMSSMTLKAGIEETVIKSVPEIKAVETVR